MPKAAGAARNYISHLSLVGRSQGAVKTLDGFKKQHHTVPDAVNATTSAFLGKLCAGELAEEGEKFYQRAKTLLAYKRTDASLDVATPAATLTTKDFVFEISYALESDDAASYEITRTLHNVRSGEMVDLPEFNELFAGVFSGIVFMLVKGVRVEAVIDAIEGGQAADGLTVSYPSDCRNCVLKVEGVDAQVICDGATLEMRFPRNGSPAELIASFEVLKAVFALSKNRTLSGMIG
ncbi:hypothetical protein [Oleiharenicola lentus]|uniref:hypothetical protein n=1 Tax=Oleiharenicola lentus TaxID=2508720 RepID=UPI003F6644DF